MSGFALQRLGQIMAPESGNAQEAQGVLNPGVVRGPDGQLNLFPRLVARGNYSRIGIAHVLFDRQRNPCGVERLGIALEPEEDYERQAGGGGGCEDPRITFVEPLGQYVMTYAALSSNGPRIAFAISQDLFTWRRLLDYDQTSIVGRRDRSVRHFLWLSQRASYSVGRPRGDAIPILNRRI